MINKEESIKKYFTILLKKRWIALSDIESKSQFIVDIKNHKWIVELTNDGLCWIQNDLIENFSFLYDMDTLTMQKILKSVIGELFSVSLDRSIAGIFSSASGCRIPYDFIV